MSLITKERFELSGQQSSEGGKASDSHQQRSDRWRLAAGLIIIFSWQILALNLFRWTQHLSPVLKLKNLHGGYNSIGSFFYFGLGALLIILRTVPQCLVQPRRYAWLVLVRKFLTRGCPSWYAEYASDVIAKTFDDLSTSIQVALASKLIVRAVPLLLDLSSLVIPLRDFFNLGAKFHMDPKSLAAINSVCSCVSADLLSIAVAVIIVRMFLELKNPPNNVGMPTSLDKAMEGTSSAWVPMVSFIVWRTYAVKRAWRMRLQLLDKIITALALAFSGIPILRLLRLKVQTVLAVGGVGGLAIGLALKNLAQNLISGVLIFINSSVCESLDVVLVEAKTSGVVSKVGWFNTRINGYDGLQVLVPNRVVLDGTVIDKTNKLFRVTDNHLLITLESHAELEPLVQKVKETLENDERVLQKREILALRRKHQGNIKAYPPQCVFEGWTELGARIRVRAYFEGTISNDQFLERQSELLLKVDQTIAASGGLVGYCNAPQGPSKSGDPQPPTAVKLIDSVVR